MRVSLLTQVTLLPALLAQRSAEAPAGAIHLGIAQTFEDGADVFGAATEDVSCTNAELCARAALLVDDLAAWYAREKGKTVRAATRADAPLVVASAAELDR